MCYLPRVVDESCNQTGPATLVSCPQATARIAVKELVVPQVVFPERVEVERVITAIDASATVIASSKKMLQAVLKFFSDMTQVHVVTRSNRAFNLKALSKKEVVSLQRLDEEEVDTDPDRATPVAVASKQPTVRIARNVAYLELLSVYLHGERVVFVVLGQRPDTVGTEELIFIQHAFQKLFQSVLADNGQEDTVTFSTLADTVHVAFHDISFVLHEPLKSSFE